MSALFGKPKHGTDCAMCPQVGYFDNKRSQYPASTRCTFCLKFLCSMCVASPFGTDHDPVFVDTCIPCGESAAKSVDANGFLHGPTAGELAQWKDRYSSETFIGYTTT